MLKIGTRVRVKEITDEVADDVKECEGKTGEVSAYEDGSGATMYYVKFDDNRPSKKFFLFELAEI